MTTARDLVTFALKECGVIGVGQDPLAEDMNDGFTLLKRMMAVWQKKRWLVPALITVNMPGNNQKSMTIGPGGYFNTYRPDKIQSGYIIQFNTGPNKVSLPLRAIFSRENYDMLALKDLNTLPTHFFYDNLFPLGNVFIWPVPSPIYQIYLTIKCYIGFSTGISKIEIENEGAAYTDGVYVQIPVIGNGVGATVDITVTAGKVAIVTANNPGDDYKIGDQVTVNAADIGGTGAGFLGTITETVQNIDSEFILPEEYEEAIHYNLAIRMCSMWQRDVKSSTIALAKDSLNTIRKANIQIPTMRMPDSLTLGPAFNIYNPDGYYGD